jgi:hypothetical protein
VALDTILLINPLPFSLAAAGCHAQKITTPMNIIKQTILVISIILLVIYLHDPKQ